MTDQQLQLLLAKMLPEKMTRIQTQIATNDYVIWGTPLDRYPYGDEVRPTEWLHVCWLVEQTVLNDQTIENDSSRWEVYQSALNQIVIRDDKRNESDYWHPVCHASWQQRAEALCRVKGITI